MDNAVEAHCKQTSPQRQQKQTTPLYPYNSGIPESEWADSTSGTSAQISAFFACRLIFNQMTLQIVIALPDKFSQSRFVAGLFLQFFQSVRLSLRSENQIVRPAQRSRCHFLVSACRCALNYSLSCRIPGL